MENNIFNLAKERKILLASHRGVCGGNIPCNTLESFEIALLQGADIVEVDVENSSDGMLFIQHPAKEPIHIGIRDSIKKYESSEISEFMRLNSDLTPTQYKIARLEEVLDLLRGKCLINIDKFWSNPIKISALVKERGMEDQVIVKSRLENVDVSVIEEYARNLQFMSIARHVDMSLELLRERSVRFIGTEILFSEDGEPVTEDSYVKTMHDAGKIIWVNPIVYDFKERLTGPHTDDVSILGNPDMGWGWLSDKGYDILQTDWLLSCSQYLKETGRRK